MDCSTCEQTQNKTHFLFLVRHGERCDQRETKDAFRSLCRNDNEKKKHFENKHNQHKKGKPINVGEEETSGEHHTGSEKSDKRACANQVRLHPHDPPLKSCLLRFLSESDKGKAHSQKKIVASEAALTIGEENGEGANNTNHTCADDVVGSEKRSIIDTSRDAALDKASAIINAYLALRPSIEKTLGLAKKGGHHHHQNDAASNRIIAITSPLQRCMTTLTHIIDRLDGSISNANNIVQGKEMIGQLAQQQELPLPSLPSPSPLHILLHVDARLYEYLSAGLFPFSPPRKQTSNDTHTDEEITPPPHHPIPYVYGNKDEPHSPYAALHDATSPNRRRSSSIRYWNPHLPSEEKKQDHADAAEKEEYTPFSPAVADSALKFIHARFPEDKKANAERRFEQFIDAFVEKVMMGAGGEERKGKRVGGDQPPDHLTSDDDCFAASDSTILCTHQFGVSAMLSHLLRSKMNKRTPILRGDSDKNDGDLLKTDNSGSKFDWRKAAAEVWTANLAPLLQKEMSSSLTSAVSVGEGHSTMVAPQFTPRIDTSSVTLVVLHWQQEEQDAMAMGTSTEKIRRQLVCTPITVGEI